MTSFAAVHTGFIYTHESERICARTHYTPFAAGRQRPTLRLYLSSTVAYSNMHKIRLI